MGTRSVSNAILIENLGTTGSQTFLRELT